MWPWLLSFVIHCTVKFSSFVRKQRNLLPPLASIVLLVSRVLLNVRVVYAL